jgi:hypothetical protein
MQTTTALSRLKQLHFAFQDHHTWYPEGCQFEEVGILIKFKALTESIQKKSALPVNRQGAWIVKP